MLEIWRTCRCSLRERQLKDLIPRRKKTSGQNVFNKPVNKRLMNLVPGEVCETPDLQVL